MTIRIAQASSSENYTKYGVAPNQRRTPGKLDGELNIIDWVGGWERVYRPIDDGVAERIAAFMEAAVRNANIGYSQDITRFGVFDALRELGSSDPAAITKPVNTDCCTLYGAGVWYAGVHHDGLRDLCTWEVDTVLAETKAFEVLSSRELCQDGVGIRRGDCLWREGHVAVALDTDKRQPRVSLTDQGLVFTDPEQFDDGPSVGVEASNTASQKPVSQRRAGKSESSVSLPSERFGLAQQEEEQTSSELTVAVVSNLPKRDDEVATQEPAEASVISSEAPKDTSVEEV